MRNLLFIILLFLTTALSAQTVGEYNFLATATPAGPGTYGMNGFFLDTDGRGFTTADITIDVTHFFDGNGQKFIIRAKTGTSPIQLDVDAVGHANSPVSGVGQISDLSPNGMPYTSGGVSGKVSSTVNNEAIAVIDAQLGAGSGGTTEWVSAQAAAVDDVVVYGGKLYTNLTGTNTATTPDADATNWARTDDGLADWSGAATYPANEIVQYNGKLYTNLTGTNTATTPDLDATNWVEVGPEVTTTPAWDAGQTYAASDIIAHSDGNLYRNLTGTNTATAPSADATNWAIVNESVTTTPKWSATETYIAADVVAHTDGNLYRNLTGTNTATTPDADATNWEIANPKVTIAPQWDATETYAAGDIIAHTNGELYYNLTGTNTATTPDADATNWLLTGGGVVSQVDAEAGTATTTSRWTAERVAQAIEARTIIEVADYTALRATTVKAVYRVTDARTGGLFVASSTVDADNGFDIIENANSQKFERIYDPNTVYMRWAEIPGEWDDVEKALAAAGNSGTVVFEYGVTYAGITKAYQVTNTNIDLNSATLEATLQYNSVVTAGAAAGSSITLTDATLFEVGQDVALANGNSDADIVSFTSGANTATVLTKVGNTITVDETLSGDATGVTLFLCSPFFKAINGVLRIKNGTIDQNSIAGVFNYSWKAGPALTGNELVDVSYVNFINIRHTAVFGSWFDFHNNTVDGTSAAIHISEGTQNDVLLQPTNIIRDNRFQNTGLNSTECGHCEGAITYSNGGYNLFVKDNMFVNSQNSLLSPFAGDDNGLFFDGNVAWSDIPYTKTALSLISAITFTGIEDEFDVTITNNVFQNVGNIQVTGFDLATGNAFYRFKIEHNTIVNGLVYLLSAQGTFINNHMYFDALFDASLVQLTGLTEYLDNSAVLIRLCEDVEVRGNTILSSQKDPDIYVGMSINRSERINVSDMTIRGFHIGVNTFQTTVSAERVIGREIVFDNCNIEVTGDTGPVGEIAVGAIISRGVTFKNSRIYAALAGEAEVWCLRTALHTQFPTSEAVPTIVVNNEFRTDHTTCMNISPSYERTDRMTIMGNFGSSLSGLNPVVENTGLAAGQFIHATTNVTREFTTLKNNWIWNSADFEIDINLPTYFDFIRL